MILLSIAMFAVLALAIWLTTLSAWWWLLSVPVILLSILLIVAFLVANIAIKVLRPSLTDRQDDDTFLRQTKHHPVFENPLESLILRKEEDKNKWHIGSEEDVPVQDIEGFTRFRQWVARVAIEAQQKQIAA